MSDGLSAFFASMERFFEAGELPGADASPARLALYREFVEGHVSGTLNKLYPLCRRALGEEAFAELAQSYYSLRPARHFDLNRCGEAFPAFLVDAPVAPCPPYLAALAGFEWADFAVYASEVEVPTSVARWTANPTLVALELPFRICAHARSGGASGPPEEGAELALLWRHPITLRTWFRAADDAALLGLKIALEQIRFEVAATAGGLSTEQIGSLMAGHARDGLVIAPAPAPAPTVPGC